MSLVNQFLNQIRHLARTQDGEQLRAWLQVDPGSNKQYFDLGAELRSHFPSSHPKKLEQTVENSLPQDEDVPEGEATAWPGLIAFVRDYFVFWKDVNYDDLLQAHVLLSGLVNSCATAFAHPSYGGMLLKTSMSLSETLARLTMLLHRRPDLMRRLHAADGSSGSAAADDAGRKSIAESSAEIIQKIFTTCLTDRSSGRYSKPEGKKVGVYMFANLVLKLLFACRRTNLAKMIFVNISTNSPPLSLYPAAQRVTFLFYLGRFNFSNGHYLRASHCLQSAYLQLPRGLTSRHRIDILTYLIPSNMLLGLFPSRTLLSRPELQSPASAATTTTTSTTTTIVANTSDKQTLTDIFVPLCNALRRGDFVSFQAHLSTHESWLFERGLLLPLTHRLRPILWRSLARRVFLLTYIPPADAATSRRAATLDVTDLLAAATFLQRRLEGWIPSNPGTTRGRPAHVNPLFMKAVRNSVTGTLSPPASGQVKVLRPNEGLIWGNTPVTVDDVEMVVATLIQQGLMHGFVAHGQGRFAIIGAKAKGSPLLAGWPTVWRAICDRRYDEEYDADEVPGWVKSL